MTDYIVRGDQWVRLRKDASLTSDILGCVKTGDTVAVESVANGWAKVLFTAGGTAVRDESTLTQRFAYMYSPLLSPKVNPTPVSTSPLLGVNVIFNGDDARNAIAKGCKFLSITFNPDLAWALKQQYPTYMIAARGNFYGGALPSDSHFLDKVGAAIQPGMIVYGVNEDDHISSGSAENIKKRAEFDAKWFAYCKARGAIYAGGGFAMGTPDITKAEIREALRKYYAPLVNAGMWFNQHTYSGNDGSKTPIKQRLWTVNSNTITWDGYTATTRQTWWLEERWRFYCAFCGFDPTKFKFISDETGVDTFPGSFKDHGYNDQEVADWCKQYCKLTGEPVLYNGVFYPSNFVGGALFQAGDDNRWAGYEVRGYYNILQTSGVWA